MLSCGCIIETNFLKSNLECGLPRPSNSIHIHGATIHSTFIYVFSSCVYAMECTRAHIYDYDCESGSITKGHA